MSAESLSKKRRSKSTNPNPSLAVTPPPEVQRRANSAAEISPTKTLPGVPEEPSLLEVYPASETLKRQRSTVAPLQVVCRVRPPTIAELSKKDDTGVCVEVLKAMNQIKIKNARSKDPRMTAKEFTYDAVFGPEDGQRKLYDSKVRPLITRCLDGYNGCVFAYGQTASGKTFTMQGPPQAGSDQYGVIQRIAIQVMEHAEKAKRESGVDFVIKASYLEIYQEKLIDLLAAGDKTQVELKIRQDPNGYGLFVQGLTERTVGSEKDILAIHAAGSRNRTVGETNMNEMSSRSHAVFTLTVIEERDSHISEQAIRKTSKINIVDLAGSERADDAGTTGTRLKEGAMINLSLSTLGNCINALSKPERERGHVPYRDSKLTYLLSDSLGGNALTLMVCCLSPVAFNYDESMSTLRFAERAKKVKNYAKINMDPKLLRILELEEEIRELKRRLRNCKCGRSVRDGDVVDTGFCSQWSVFKMFRNKGKKVAPANSTHSAKSLPPPPIDKDAAPAAGKRIVKSASLRADA